MRRNLFVSGLLTLLERKTKMSLYLGSTQKQVPVNPVCPNVRGDADKHGYGSARVALSFSGLSKPSPRRLFSLWYSLKYSTVERRKKFCPFNTPPFNNTCPRTAIS